MPNPRPTWRFPTQWNVVHADGRHIRLEVAQDANSFIGSAHYTPTGEAENKTGTVNGSVDGHQFNMVIYWPDAEIEIYDGTVNSQGAVEGTKSDEKISDAFIRWSGNPALKEWR